MIHRLLKEERGYSLVEVVVSILILSIAILPMVGMFDMGINAATKGSDYDKARALANLKMEQAKSLSFVEVQDNFPEPEIPTPYAGVPVDRDTLFIEPDPEFANVQYNIKKQYMKETPYSPGDDLPNPEENFLECIPENDCTPPTGLIRVSVTVHWDDNNADPDEDLSDDNTYTTWGLVAE